MTGTRLGGGSDGRPAAGARARCGTPHYRLLAASLALSLLAAGPVGGRRGLAGRRARAAVRRRCRWSPPSRAGGMLASTLLGGALADRIPQRRILLARGWSRRRRGRRSPCCPWPARVALWQLAAVVARRRRGDGPLLPGLLGAGPRARARRRPARGQRARGRGPADAGRGRRPGRRGLPRRRVVARARPWPPPPWRSLLAAACLAALPTTPVRRDAGRRRAPAGLLADVREGFVYMVRDAVAAGHAAVRVADAAGLHGPARGAGAVRDQGRRRRSQPARLRAGGVRPRRGGRLARRRLAAAAPALPDGDEPAVGPGLRPDGGLRFHAPASGR